MNIQLENRNVLITGAATGIGRAIASEFTKAGAKVFANHFNQHAIAEAMVKLGDVSNAYSADVSQRQAVESMVRDISEFHGSIDVLVNNAGISRPKPFLEMSEQDWDDTININLKGAMLCSQSVLPGMIKKGHGIIINIVSELGYLGRENFAAYTASKGGLISLTRTLAREFAPKIRVNGIAPGPVMTDLLRGEINTHQDLEKEMDIPLKRIAQPEEIAGSALFLASDYAAFYCGEILNPNGGALMR